MNSKNILAFILILVVIIAFLAYYFISDKKSMNEFPIISVENNTIDVSVSDGNDVLLSGVTAYDKEDGDVSDKIVLESISQFDSDGCRTVTFAAFDSSNHVVKGTRKIKYTDYVSPTFSLQKSLSFYSVTEEIILTMVTANDVLDGDISSKIVVESSDLIDEEKGKYEVILNVTNSAGDTSNIVLHLISSSRSTFVPKIELNNQIVYVNKNTNLDFDSFVSASSSGIDGESAKVKFETDYDKSTSGNYIVTYYAENSKGYVGYAFLTVVVR